ncbi:hypothetical protein [Paenibacillus sp. BK720]|uniref:hypothetical protein n=1 Tax=Paenibacillus sp. BK720 TaxID=2587092 RepID=UPI00141DD316|nr:hypothetical protein [Paenibacillus sp. BK720]NIK71607.1 hypothetical protein [Paenibacillus sp. BK720]
MTNHPIDERKQANLPTPEETNDAWAKLALKLKEHEGSTAWAAWTKEGVTAEDTEHKAAGLTAMTGEEHSAYPERALEEQERRAAKPVPSPYRGWLKKHGVKTGVAAAAVLICAAIAIPSTNEALASILGKFKMNQVAVVQEDDFKTALEGFFGADVSAESSNKFGQFERTFTGEDASDLTVGQVREKYGIELKEKLDLPPYGKQAELQIYAQQGQALTLRLDVDEINDVMKKLGAKQLLPASVDGKAITLRMGEGINADYSFVDSNEKSHYVGVNIIPVPVVEMDPSIEAEDAYEALIRFPVLPANLKNVLMQSTRISEGEVPFPIITNGNVTKSVVNGTDVYFEGSKNDWNGWNATWLKNGKVTQVQMYDAASREEAERIVKELIAQ